MQPAALLVGLILACLPLGSSAETWLVGPGGTPMSLKDAVQRAADDDVVELLPGQYVGEVTVIPAKRLTLRGMGKGVVFDAKGKVAEGKAILVMRGGDLTVENIEFRGARADDANGAGIRLESGHLRVLRCRFADNEMSILTSNDGKAELDVVDSSFGEAPAVVGGLYHLLYVGRIARLQVTGSRFQRGFEGHLLKSRARESRIEYNMIVDGPGGEASYEIDLPNGGLATVVGNVIGQAAGSQNPVVVAYGAEGKIWDRNALYLAHNTLVNDKRLPAWFLRVFSDRLPADTRIEAINNLTVGPGFFEWTAPGHFAGNAHVWARALVEPAVMAFDLKPDSGLSGTGVDPRAVGGQDLSPKAEFTPPIGTRPLPPLTRWTPGAYQGVR